MKSRGTTIALALFLGGFGAHRFYLGQGGLGLIYLLFCWTFIPVFIAIIDILAFATMGQDTFDNKYNKLMLGLLKDKSVTINNGNRDSSMREKLNELNNLKSDGLVTPEEYEIRRKRILES